MVHVVQIVCLVQMTCSINKYCFLLIKRVFYSKEKVLFKRRVYH